MEIPLQSLLVESETEYLVLIGLLLYPLSFLNNFTYHQLCLK